MWALTPAERRGAVIVVGLLVLGSVYDGWRARHPEPRRLLPDDRGHDSSHGRPADTIGSVAAGLRPGSSLDPRVDLNRATPEELDALPGIGPVLAARIVQHRSVHGAFHRPEDLLAVPGIGLRVLERLKPRVVVGPETASRAR